MQIYCGGFDDGRRLTVSHLEKSVYGRCSRILDGRVGLCFEIYSFAGDRAPRSEARQRFVGLGRTCSFGGFRTSCSAVGYLDGVLTTDRTLLRISNQERTCTANRALWRILRQRSSRELAIPVKWIGGRWASHSTSAYTTRCAPIQIQHGNIHAPSDH